MIVKVEQILQAKESLNTLSMMKIPIYVSFGISKIIHKINDELRAFEDARLILIKKYGYEESKDKWKVKEENIEKFQPEVKKLMEIEFDLNTKKIKVKDLGDITIAPALLYNLDFLLEE